MNPQPEHKPEEQANSAQGGVNIGGAAHVEVGHDLVGGNKNVGQEFNVAGHNNVVTITVGPVPPTPAEFAAAERIYLEQIINRTELVEFTGIPEHQDHSEIRLPDIFVPLGIEQEIEQRPGLYPVRSGEPWDEYMERVVSSPERQATRRVTLREAFSTNLNLMVLGDPGSGKSTLLRYLSFVAAHALLQRANPPHHPSSKRGFQSSVQLRGFAASESTISGRIFLCCRRANLSDRLPPKFFESALDAGRCLVCFDGLDEVVLPSQRVTVRDAVTALAAR